MGKEIREYTAVIRPEYQNQVTEEFVQTTLTSIPGVQSVRVSNGVFEFKTTYRVYKEVRAKLQMWCIIERDRIMRKLFDHGGESG